MRAGALTALAPHLPEADRPGVLAQALAAATATSSDYSPARALTALAPHLPPDLLAQALATVTAISDGKDRAAALARMAPHLPADLLPRAVSSASGSEQTLTALLERAWLFHTRDGSVLYVALLRDCLTGINRPDCLRILAAAATAIRAIGGAAAVSRCADAVTNACRWWP